MKKIYLFILLCLNVSSLFSQGAITHTKTDVDLMLSNINRSNVNGGIVYDKCIQYADLSNFNSATNNSANKALFEQAITDLYIASDEQQFISYTALTSRYSISPSNLVDIGILNASFSTVNYNKYDPVLSGVSLVNDKFELINGRQAFNNFNKLIIAPLKENVLCVNNQIEFRFNSNLIFSNNTNSIKNLAVDFGDGATVNVINNGILTNSSHFVTFSTQGKKVLQFNVTFNDNSVIVTYGILHVKPDITTEGVDPLIENGKLISTIPFQGYDEINPIFGELDYRIFYHTNNGNTSPTLLKPIIISDGFDPQDKRKIQATDYINPDDFQKNSSIEHFMDFKDCNGNTSNLITILRSRGYDVVVVNYPNYIRNGKNINGGADYIERNAMSMITLIQKLNTILQTNGSNEQLAIAAPSMGGQITRFALAYMEKQFAQTSLAKWKHNTRVWISIDSPHLGANIPYGLQSIIYLASLYGSSSADDFFYNQLKSPAAKQQLIEQLDVVNTVYLKPDSRNGRTVSQGYSYSNGNPFFQTFYDNLFTNGLPNSKGYPMNTRKIAVVNGSLSGASFGTSNEKVIDLVGFKKIIAWDHKGFQGIAHAMADYQSTATTLTTFMVNKVTSNFFGSLSNIYNNNDRGNMDLISGGWFPGYEEFVTKTRKENDEKVSYWEERVNAKIHSFIPSYSALGIKQPEQDWSQPLTRNLVCSDETPFDSYYGESENTQHTSFNCKSVAWMLKELDGQPQAPVYPFSAELHGPKTVCNLNQNFTVTFGNNSLCKFPTAVTWSLSPNLVLVSSDDNSIVVKAVSGGEALVSASLGTGQSYSYPVYIGALPSSISIVGMQNTNTGITSSTVWTFSAPKFTGATYFWYLKGNKYLSTGKNNSLELLIPCGVTFDVQCKLINDCGMTSLSNTVSTSVGYCKRKRDAGINTFFINQPIEAPKKLNISVATISSELFGHLFYNKESLADEMIQGVNVYNKKGEQVLQTGTLDTKNTQVDFTDLQDGTYFIEILGKNDFKELHTFYYSQLNQEEYILDNIANGSITINSDRAADRLYVMQQKLFNDLQCNQDAMDVSTTLKEFVSENATSSFGYIWLIQNALGRDDIAKAEQILERWQTTNTIDQNFKNYYQFYIKVVNNKPLSESENEILHVIAQGCPLVDGEIVYAARDLYTYLNPDNSDNYSNACSAIGLKMSHQDYGGETFSKNVNIVYPNPTKGNITIDNLDYGAKNIVITDIYGKVILQKTTTNQLLNLQLNIKSGVYFITISNNKTGKSETQKLIIHN